MTDYRPPVGGAQRPWRRAETRRASGLPAGRVPDPAAATKAPGWLLIVVATAVSGTLGLHLTMERAAAARRLGRPVRRYWLAWAIPFALWLPAVVYATLFDRG